MRSVTPAPARRSLVLASAVGLALAGCSLDLDLPGAPTSPTVTGFSPAAAFAGQLLQVQGGHFAADAAENTVNFAHASARAEGWAGGDLLVRVPGDAGDGPITVSNREGTSAATAEAFAYRGLGELRRGQLVSTEPILHHPLRVHAVAGSVLIESALLRQEGTQEHGLVRYGMPIDLPAPVSASASAPWRDELLTTLDDDTGTTVTTWPLDGSGPARLHRIPGIRPWRILPVRPSPADPTQDLLVTFQLENDVDTIRTFRLDESTHGAHDHSAGLPQSLPVLLGSTPLGLSAVAGPADVQDGRIVVVAGDGLGGGVLAVIDLSTGAVLGSVSPPNGRFLPYSNDRYFDALAAGRKFNGTGHLAAVALDAGHVMLVDLDNLGAGDPSAYTTLVSTFSAARVSGLALASTGGTGQGTVVVATKPDDDLVIGIDTGFNEVVWGLETRGARRVAAVDTTAWIANDEDNEIQIVNVATARPVGRLAFDVAPGTFDAFGDPDPAGGLVFAAADPLDPYAVDTLYVMALSPPAILKRPLDSYEPASCLFRDETLTQVAWDAASRTPWGLERALYADPLRALAFTGASRATVPIAGAASARRIVFTPSGAVVAHDAGLAAIGTGGGAVDGFVTVTDPTWGSVAPAPDGRVWLTGTWGGVDHVQLWSYAEVAAGAGGAPDAEFTDPALWIFWGVWLEDGLWVDTWDGVTDPVMVRLEESGGVLLSAETVTPAAAGSFLLIPPAAVSPNGRTLVMWEYRGLDTALRLFSADPSTGFAELGYIPLDGTITGAAFDDTGERLYVVTQAPDRVVIID